MGAMDRREGFHAAVIKLRSPEWSPAFPNMNTLNVDGEYWTIRQVCELVKDDDGVLPDEIVWSVEDIWCGFRRDRRRRPETGLCLLRGRIWTAISGQAADEGRGAADRGEYRQAAGVGAKSVALIARHSLLGFLRDFHQ